MKLSFKKDPKPTGLYSVGNPNPDTHIKLDGKEIGVIVPPSWNSSHADWVIRFMVIKEHIEEDGNTNCSWKWITLKKHFDDELSARNFIKEHKNVLLGKFNFYFMDIYS